MSELEEFLIQQEWFDKENSSAPELVDRINTFLNEENMMPEQHQVTIKITFSISEDSDRGVHLKDLEELLKYKPGDPVYQGSVCSYILEDIINKGSNIIIKEVS